MGIVALFGGTGFIGRYFAQYLLENNKTSKVYLADIKPVGAAFTTQAFQKFQAEGKIGYLSVDVRLPIAEQINESLENIKLIANFAAIHREPGHETQEYYATNLLGATNVCAFAATAACEKIIFTSSIAPYGPTEEEKTEASLTVPTTAYGGSKLVAEKIHIAWQKEQKDARRLVIVRPGVVFGAGEGGNVTRMIRAVLNYYFFYVGNHHTRKAGVYVKELCHAMSWVLDNQDYFGEKISLFNMSMNPGPTVEQYVEAVKQVSNKQRNVRALPFNLLYLASFLVAGLTKLFGIQQPISPVRLKKLIRSNNILPAFLVAKGYNFQYDLTSAFSDWKAENPVDWQ